MDNTENGSEVEGGTKEFSIGLTTYEINKRMYEHMNPMEPKKLLTQYSSIGAWFSTHLYDDYYCLMCREEYDFTIFHFNNKNYSKGMTEVREVLESRGTVIDIQYDHDNDGYNCWVKDKNGTAKMFYLFNCQFMVVEVE